MVKAAGLRWHIHHPAVLALFEHHRDRKTSPSVDDLTDVLTSTLESYEELFLVIDGLDECVEQLRWELIEHLERFRLKLWVLVTSRYLDAIAEELASFERFEIKADRGDIEIYIDYQIKKNRNLREIVQKAPMIRNDIKAAVAKPAESTFLLARLHVESLTSAAGLSVRHVRLKLQSLPNSLQARYDSVMQRIADQEPDHKRIALKTPA